jgi:hypothetical protein
MQPSQQNHKTLMMPRRLPFCPIGKTMLTALYDVNWFEMCPFAGRVNDRIVVHDALERDLGLGVVCT